MALRCRDRNRFWTPVGDDWFERADATGYVYATVREERVPAVPRRRHDPQPPPEHRWVWSIFIGGEEAFAGPPKATALEAMDDYDARVSANPFLAEVLPTAFEAHDG